MSNGRSETNSVLFAYDLKKNHHRNQGRPGSTMPQTRVLGIDYGARRVGAAICDPRRKIATPLEVYERRDPTQDARHYRALVEEHDVDLIVVGLPLHSGGTESESSKKARAWGAWLAETTGIPLTYFDERNTSIYADEILIGVGFKYRQRKSKRDMVAANILLQNFLDAGCPMLTVPGESLDESES